MKQRRYLGHRYECASMLVAEGRRATDWQICSALNRFCCSAAAASSLPLPPLPPFSLSSCVSADQSRSRQFKLDGLESVESVSKQIGYAETNDKDNTTTAEHHTTTTTPHKDGKGRGQTVGRLTAAQVNERL